MGNSANPSESSDAGKDCHLVPDTDPLRAKDCSLGVLPWAGQLFLAKGDLGRLSGVPSRAKSLAAGRGLCSLTGWPLQLLPFAHCL